MIVRKQENTKKETLRTRRIIMTLKSTAALEINIITRPLVRCTGVSHLPVHDIPWINQDDEKHQAHSPVLGLGEGPDLPEYI
jgi:hypothetical protein